jgi:hypothetical protein
VIIAVRVYLAINVDLPEQDAGRQLNVWEITVWAANCKVWNVLQANPPTIR